MNKQIPLYLITIAVLLGLSCELPREAVGSYRKIPVFADEGERDEIAPLLSAALERKITTPRDETIFTLEYIDTTQYDRLKSARTVIIAASLESPGPAGEFIRTSLSPDAIKAVKANEYWIVAKENLWADGQLVVILIAPNEDALSVRLQLGSAELFNLINDSVNERVSQWLFGSAFGEGERIALEDSIASSYGFGIRVPRYWEWEKGAPDERFLWLRALEPERWVFVWWTEMDSTTDFSVEWWRHIRDSLCAIYYEGDSVSPEFVPETSGVYIGGRPAVQIRALWENRNTNLGGPILSYVLSDPRTQRLFIVDGAVFAPAVKKEPYLRHVEIVCKSLRGDLPSFLDKREGRR